MSDFEGNPGPAARSGRGASDATLRLHANLDERLESVATLGDPVRREVYQTLQRNAEAMTRNQLAELTGLSSSTLLFHLEKLVNAGLLNVEFRKLGERSGPGSGRPAKLYQLAHAEVTASVPDRRYDLAAELMAAAIEASIRENVAIQPALSKTAYDAGRRLGLKAGSIDGVLDSSGYEPYPDGDGGFLLHNCPFHRLSRSHSEVVCGMNGALLSGALEGSGDVTHAVTPDPEGPHCCARITRRTDAR
jgi:predicted ArsR family transcriptional regulator